MDTTDKQIQQAKQRGSDREKKKKIQLKEVHYTRTACSKAEIKAQGPFPHQTAWCWRHLPRRWSRWECGTAAAEPAAARRSLLPPPGSYTAGSACGSATAGPGLAGSRALAWTRSTRQWGGRCDCWAAAASYLPRNLVGTRHRCLKVRPFGSCSIIPAL